MKLRSVKAEPYWSLRQRRKKNKGLDPVSFKCWILCSSQIVHGGLGVWLKFTSGTSHDGCDNRTNALTFITLNYSGGRVELRDSCVSGNCHYSSTPPLLKIVLVATRVSCSPVAQAGPELLCNREWLWTHLNFEFWVYKHAPPLSMPQFINF